MGGVGGGCPGLPCPIDGAGSSRLFVRFTCFSLIHFVVFR